MAERIRGELLKLSVKVSKRTVQRIMWKARCDTDPDAKQTWRNFVSNHHRQLWACDFVQVHDLLFRSIFAFFIIDVPTRRVVHVGVTRCPTERWVTQQLREATAWDQAPKYLLLDNDSKFGAEFGALAKYTGINLVHTAVHAPLMNSVCERFIGSVRRECLDHVIILNEAGMRRLVLEYVRYFNEFRPPQAGLLSASWIGGRRLGGLLRVVAVHGSEGVEVAEHAMLEIPGKGQVLGDLLPEIVTQAVEEAHGLGAEDRRAAAVRLRHRAPLVQQCVEPVTGIQEPGGDRTGAICIAVLVSCTAIAITPDLAGAEIVGFTWRNYPGDPARGIPPGDYTTRVKNQNTSICQGGCALFSGVGAMEMQIKIEQRNPEMMINLSEAELWQNYIDPNVAGDCSGSCAVSGGYRHSCVLRGLRDQGIPRQGAYDFKYRISSYQDLHGIVTNPTLLHDELQNGPIVTNMSVSGTSYDLTSCGAALHGIIIIGYEYNTGSGEMFVHVKNSWGLKTQNGFDLFQWIPAGVCGMGVYVSWSLSGVYVDPSPATHPFDADGDGILDHIDQCLNHANVSNRNLDGDWNGDECDLDKDNDGVLDIDDCDPLNKYVAYDLDGDGHCDDFWFGCEGNNCPVTPAVTEFCSHDGPWSPQHAGACCIEECDRLDAMNRSDFDYGDCFSRCTVGMDNCSPDLSVSGCANVHTCLTQRGSSPYCNSGNIGFQQVTRPRVVDLDACQALSFNNGQQDTNGSWPGDRCETRALDLEVDPGPRTQVGGGMCLRDTYRVEFRANSEVYDPYSMPADRTQRGTSIESCHCNYLDSSTGELDWEPQCETNVCRPDRRGDWNPIRAPAFGNDPYTHPYGGPMSWSDDTAYRGVFTVGYEMARDREVAFSRSTISWGANSPDNLYTFHWDWPNTKVYPRPWPQQGPASPFGNVQDAELMSVGQVTRPFKVRVSWSPTVVGEDGQFDEVNQVLLSRGVFTITGQHMCPPIPPMSTRDAPRWLAPNAPVSEALLRQPRPLGWAMMRSEAGENVVVSFDRSLAEPTAVQEATYLAGTSATERFVDGPTVAARLDPALLPATVDPGPRQAGKATALLAYSSDLPGELTDSEVPPPLAPGESAGLWMGLVRGPDNLWLTAAQALGAAAGQAPALAAPQLLFDSRTQALYLLGHEVEGGEVVASARYMHNVLWRLAFGSGTWQRLGQVEALGRTVGYSVSYDPIKRRAVIFGGVQDGEPSERLLSVDLVTLSARTLWSGEGLTGVTHARERHGAYLDPVGRQLYVYGGSRAGTPLSDAEAFHLVASSWTPLWAGGAGGAG